MNKARFGRLPIPMPDPDPAGGGGGGGGAPAGGDPNAWKVTLAGGNQDYAKVLEPFQKPDEIIERLTKPEFDWRKAAAGDNPDELKNLERFTDVGTLYKAFKDNQAAARDPNRVRVPGADAKPEEVAAFAKQVYGVPEKIEDYKVTAKPPEGYEPNDNDKGLLNRLTEKLHGALAKGAKANDIVDLAQGFYWEEMSQSLVQAEERAADAAVATETLLRDKWGGQYEENVNWAIAGIQQYFPGSKDELHEFLSIPLPGGTKLGDDPRVLQMFAQVGRQHAEDPFFLKAAGKADSFDPEKRKAELLALKETDPKRYASPEVQTELDKIYAGLQRRQEMAAAR